MSQHYGQKITSAMVSLPNGRGSWSISGSREVSQKLQGDYNDIGVPSFILPGAPIISMR
jgi:hypothetical protein